MALASVLIFVAIGQSRLMWEEWVVHEAVGALSFGLLLVFIVPRQPRNGAVWAVGWSGFLFGVHGLAHAISIWRVHDRFGRELVPEFRSLPDLPSDIFIFAWFDQWLFIPAVGLFLTFGFLLFPTGRLPGPRWQVVAWLAAVSIIGLSVGLAPIDQLVTDESSDPLLFTVFLPLLGVAQLASLVSLVVRYRRADGELRHQLRWMGFGAAVFIANSLLPESLSQVVALPGILFLVVCYGIAVLKYRLYDIDIVVSKSVTYLGLAGAITLLYAAVVVGPLILIGVDDEGGDPGLVLPIVATVLVAVLFEPIRARTQRWANRLVYGERSSPHEVLSRLSVTLSHEAAEGTDELARLLASGTGADQAVVWIRVGNTLHPHGSWPVQELDPVAANALVDNDLAIAAEIRHGEDSLGALSILKPRGDPVNEADRALVVDVAAGSGMVLRNIRLNAELEARAAELRASRKRLIAAQDSERHRLERDLHDGAQQHLVALTVRLGIARAVAESAGEGVVAEGIDQLAHATQDAVESMRTIAHGIYPPLLETEGLEPTLAGFQSVEIVEPSLGRLPRHIEETVYFCVRELIDLGGGAEILVARTDIAIELTASFDAADDLPKLTALTDRIDSAEGALAVDGKTIRVALPVGELEAA